MKGRHLVRLLILGLVVAIGWAQDKPKSGEKAAQETPASPQAVVPQPVHGFKLTPEDAARKNPTKFTTLTVERGKKIYDTQCEMCHGTKGDGKGEVAVEMKITPPDFTKPETLDKRTDGELFAILGMGSEAMPGQGTRMSEAHKWNLINYLRALSGKQPQKPTGKEPEEGIILVPQEPK